MADDPGPARERAAVAAELAARARRVSDEAADRLTAAMRDLAHAPGGLANLGADAARDVAGFLARRGAVGAAGGDERPADATVRGRPATLPPMPPAPLRCRALLFDLDGVLADSTASVEAHWRRWAAGHGLDPDAILHVVHGRRAIDTIREVAPALDAERELAALPGAAELLPRLAAGSWAVVTSGMRAVALARLRASALPEPPLLVAAEDVGRGKPDPEGYLAAAARLGRSPAECVVFEDAPAGVAAARAAGMRCVALASTYPTADLAAADLVVPSLAGVRVEASAAPDGGAAYVVAPAAPPRPARP
jgi:sugar-phosphatase